MNIWVGSNQHNAWYSETHSPVALKQIWHMWLEQALRAWENCCSCCLPTPRLPTPRLPESLSKISSNTTRTWDHLCWKGTLLFVENIRTWPHQNIGEQNVKCLKKITAMCKTDNQLIYFNHDLHLNRSLCSRVRLGLYVSHIELFWTKISLLIFAT